MKKILHAVLSLCISVFVIGAFLFSPLNQVRMPVEAAGTFVVDNDGVLWSYRGGGGDIVLPDEVTAIAGYAFSGSDITGITFSDNVNYVGSFAFWNCKNLKTVQFNQSLKAIYGWAFNGCSSLTELTITAHEVGPEAFCGCTSLSKVTLTDDVTNIDATAFGSTVLEKSGLLQDGFLIIKDRLCGCYGNKTTVEVPDGIAIIGSQAFVLSPFLEEVQLPEGITTIADHAFESTPLRSITLPKSVTSIEDNAFAYCSNLTEVTVNGDIDSFGQNVFYMSDSLDQVTFTEGVTTIPAYAFWKSTVKHVVIPDSLTSVGSYAFYNCRNLLPVDLKDEVICEAHAFELLNLIPGDVDYNGDVNLMDARLALKAFLGIDTETYEMIQVADFNSNGMVELSEVTKILKIALTIDTE